MFLSEEVIQIIRFVDKDGRDGEINGTKIEEDYR